MEKLKSAPRDFPKVGFKILRTTVGAGGGAGGRENGAFGTEIFRRIRQEGSRSPKIHHTLIIINYSPNKNLHLGFRQKLGSKFCVPPLWQGGGRNATKSGRLVLKFSGESARNGPGARKSPNSIFYINFLQHFFTTIFTTTSYNYFYNFIRYLIN